MRLLEEGGIVLSRVGNLSKMTYGDGLPDNDDAMPTWFGSPRDLLRMVRPNRPVMCICQAAIRHEAERFSKGFPGAVHYAVKANPRKEVLEAVVKGGVSGFDVASIPEIESVVKIFGQGKMHMAFNHPVKSREDIRRAYHQFGIRDFVVDHIQELNKISELCGRDCVIQVRIARANPECIGDLNVKFGCGLEEAAEVMRTAKIDGFRVAGAIHVGWQTLNPEAYGKALSILAEAVSLAEVKLEYANLGGGFPSILMPKTLTLEKYFDAIREAKEKIMPNVPFNCEPGSAMAWKGCALITEVLLRKETRVYINDGIYGSMLELLFSKIEPPTAVFRGGKKLESDAKTRLTICGATCDSIDIIPAPMNLVSEVTEGDFIVFQWMGAYSNATTTRFNGFGRLAFVLVDSVDD